MSTVVARTEPDSHPEPAGRQLDLRPASELDRDVWLRTIAADDAATVWQHPDVLFAGLRPEEPAPLVFRPSRGLAASPPPEALGVLAGKIYRLHGPPGCPPRRLSGHRLVGDRLIGSDPLAATDQFARDIIHWVAQRGTDFILFEELPLDAPLRTAVLAASRQQRLLAIEPAAPQPHWRIAFPEQAADYWQKHSSKSRAEFRRRARKFDHELVRITAPDDVPEFLTDCRTICEQSWKVDRLGLRIRADERELTLFSRIAIEGGFVGYLLRHRGQPVAFNILSHRCGNFIWQETCFDDRFAANSPGQILFFLMLQDLAEQYSPRQLDLGFGDGKHKQMFGTHATLSGPLLICRRELPNQLYDGYRRLKTWAGAHGRAVLHRIGLHQTLRQLRHRH